MHSYEITLQIVLSTEIILEIIYCPLDQIIQTKFSFKRSGLGSSIRNQDSTSQL